MVQDFCPGGVFVSFEESGGGRVAPIEQNETVQIEFAATAEGGSKTFRLRARVAGTFKSGIGCEFFDPNPDALAALKQIANEAASIKRATAPAGRPSRRPEWPAPRSDAPALVGHCKQLLSNYLEPQLEDLMQRAEEILFTRAREAGSNVEQNKFFDTIKELTTLKGPIETGFFRTVVEQMDNLGEPLEAMREPEPEPELSSNLSLVESGEFADWLAVKQIFTRAENRHRQAIFELQERLGFLGNVTLSEDNNPVGLAALCHTFHDAVQTVAAPRLAREVVFQAFDDTLVANLERLYERLNEYLIEQDVLREMTWQVPKVKKTASQRPPETRASSGGAPAANVYGDSAAGAAEHQGFQAPPPGAGGPAGSPGTHPGRAGGPAGSPGAHPGRASGVPSGAGGAAASARAYAPVESFAEAEAQELWTGEMAPHPSVVQGVPFNPYAMVRGSVYQQAPAEATQGAYRAIQSLLHLGHQIAPADDPGAQELPTYDLEQVRGALETLQRQESSQPAPPADGLDLKTRVERALRSRHGYTEKKRLGETETNAIEVISRLVGSIVEDVLLSDVVKPRVKKLEVPLLNVAMKEPEFFSAPSHPARRVVNQLGRVNIPVDARGEADPNVARAVDSVVDDLVEHSVDEVDAFTQAAQRLDALIEQQASAREVNIREVVKSCEQQQALIKERTGATEPPTAKRDLPEEWQQWLSRAKRLQVGDTVLLDKDTDHPQQAALAWMGEDYATYVFVDNQGLKASTMSLPELAMQLRRGSADVIAEAELAPVDRGLYEMLRQMHDQVAHQATHDPLTELVNAKEFEARLEAAIGDAKNKDSQHVLYLIDLDRFHAINEACGPKVGDRLIKELGRAIRKNVGNQGIVARLEGDKFGVMIEECSEERGFELADKQRRAIEQSRATYKGKPLSLSASIGLVGIYEGSESARALLEAAGTARDGAKLEGGNRIEVYHPGAASRSRDNSRQAWTTRVQEALAHGRLELRCQKIRPTVDDGTHRSHYEILIGVHDGEGNRVLPGEFIQGAELCNQITAVDRWVIQNTFEWMAGNKRKLTKLGGFAINLSGQSLSDDGILEFVLDQFNQSKLPPAKVLFEVTESASINSLSNAETFIRVLKEYGCRFSLDDFGSAHSSYSYLKHLPVDYVKIDGMFVKDVVDSPTDHAMVKSINEIGHFMGKKTIAEYVENDEILEQLSEIGVDYVQGFGIEKPRLLHEL